MATYLVFTRTETTDQSEMDIYNSKAGATFKGHVAKPLVAYGAQEILEGPAHEGMVIIEFPDKDAALGWYNSPAYREAREHRFRGSNYQVTIVQGL